MRTALLFPTKAAGVNCLDAYLTSPRLEGVKGSAVVCLLSWDQTATAPFTTQADVAHGSGMLLFVCQIVTLVVTHLFVLLDTPSLLLLKHFDKLVIWVILIKIVVT